MLSYLLRIIFWFAVNFILLACIIFTLEYFHIWSMKDYIAVLFDDGSQEDVRLADKNPFLLKNEELKNWEKSLKSREQLLKLRKAALEEVRNNHQELLTQLKQKTDELNIRIEKFNNMSKVKHDEKAQLQDIAKKLITMPPVNAVKILEGLDTLLVIDILDQIDQDAMIAGDESISPFLLSQMNVKKAREIIRVKDKFPVRMKKQDAVNVG